MRRLMRVIAVGVVLVLVPGAVWVGAQGGDDPMPDDDQINWCLDDGPWAGGLCGDGSTWESRWYWTCGWYHAHAEQGLLALESLPGMCRLAPAVLVSTGESGAAAVPYTLDTCYMQITGGITIGGSGEPTASMSAGSRIVPAAAGIALRFEVIVNDPAHPAYGTVRASATVLTLADGTATYTISPKTYVVEPAPTSWLHRWSFVNPAMGTTTCETTVSFGVLADE